MMAREVTKGNPKLHQCVPLRFVPGSALSNKGRRRQLRDMHNRARRNRPRRHPPPMYQLDPKRLQDLRLTRIGGMAANVYFLGLTSMLTDVSSEMVTAICRSISSSRWG